MISRNGFIRGAVATAAMAGVGSVKAGAGKNFLPVPEGREFAGMAGTCPDAASAASSRRARACAESTWGNPRPTPRPRRG